MKEIFQRQKIGEAKMLVGQICLLFILSKFLIEILFGQSFLSWFKEEIILETSIISVGTIKKYSIFKGGR